MKWTDAQPRRLDPPAVAVANVNEYKSFSVLIHDTLSILSDI